MSHSPSLLFPWILFAALDWFKQSVVILHSQREVLTWQDTVHRYLKFIFDQLCVASVSWVWPFNGHQRENPLQRLPIEANQLQFHHYIFWWEIKPLVNVCNDSVIELHKVLLLLWPLCWQLFDLQLLGLLRKNLLTSS